MFGPWVGKIPWSRKWQPTPVFLSEKSHGQRSLAGYSPWGGKDSEMTEQLSTQGYNKTKYQGKLDLIQNFVHVSHLAKF